MDYFHELEALLDVSSAPYSGFNVASVVVYSDGSVFKGVNVESVAYPTTICAERNAIFSAVSAGMKRGDLLEVHILARNENKEIVAAFPCGSCRQVIAEQSSNRATVYVYDLSKKFTTHTISSLLPHAFVSLT